MMNIIPGSERSFCRVEGCQLLAWANVPFGFCVDHLREHLMGVDSPHKPGWPPIGSTMNQVVVYEQSAAQASNNRYGPQEDVTTFLVSERQRLAYQDSLRVRQFNPDGGPSWATSQQLNDDAHQQLGDVGGHFLEGVSPFDPIRKAQ